MPRQAMSPTCTECVEKLLTIKLFDIEGVKGGLQSTWADPMLNRTNVFHQHKGAASLNLFLWCNIHSQDATLQAKVTAEGRQHRLSSEWVQWNSLPSYLRLTWVTGQIIWTSSAWQQRVEMRSNKIVVAINFHSNRVHPSQRSFKQLKISRCTALIGLLFCWNSSYAPLHYVHLLHHPCLHVGLYNEQKHDGISGINQQ